MAARPGHPAHHVRHAGLAQPAGDGERLAPARKRPEPHAVERACARHLPHRHAQPAAAGLGRRRPRLGAGAVLAEHLTAGRLRVAARGRRVRLARCDGKRGRQREQRHDRARAHGAPAPHGRYLRSRDSSSSAWRVKRDSGSPWS